MRRTISGMIGAGSLAHNRRDFVAENVDPDRVHLNICYQNENLKEVYKELFDDSVERYNVGKRKDRQITNYYEKIRQGKQEKLFHEVIFQIGNREDMAVGTTEGDLAVKVLDEYVKNFQQRNPTLHVFSCYLQQDEATPHLHIDFVPYVTGWKGKGMDTRVSLKQALKSLGFQGGNKHDTELNQWINHEKELLAEIARQYGIEWEQKGTHEEHLDVIRYTVEKVAKRIPVIAGTGSNCTATAIYLSQEAEKAGADALLLVTPYYNKATQNGLIAHYTAIAESVKLPIVLYNVPSRTGCNIQPQTAVYLAKNVENIVAIKEASGDISQVATLMQMADGCIDLYSGNDDQIVPMMSLGAKGVISVLSNVAPKETHDIVALYNEGKVKESCDLQLKALPLIHALFSEVNPIPVKKALNLMGKEVGPLRGPLSEMEEEHAAKLAEEMKKFGIKLAE